MKYLKCISIVIAAITFVSCEREELAIPKPTPSNAEHDSLSMGNNYAWQIYYDLETGKMVSKNKKTDWDLSFETAADGFHIFLNSGKSMFVYNTHSTDFNAMNDTAGKLTNRSWDEPSGNPDSTAIGDWKTENSVYFIDRGYDEDANRLGFKKVQFLKVDAVSYEVKIADIDGSNMVQMVINKDSSYNLMFLSLQTAAVLPIEPPKDRWDIVFTQYTHVFYETEEVMPYLVTGCLMNRYNTMAVKDSLNAFNLIDFSFAEGLTFNKGINTIGYDWKVYANSVYTTNPDFIYIIKNRNGLFFKLHFLDFYNATGEKGSPSFEYQQL